jgi:hypothetical protein
MSSLRIAPWVDTEQMPPVASRRRALAVAAVAGLDLSLVDVIVLFGIAVILPLALGGRGLGWMAVSGAAAVSFLLPTGRGALLVVPLLVMTSLLLATALRSFLAEPTVETGSTTLVRVFAVVAAGALAQSRGGLVLFDLHEPIVELTAVHYTFAGAAALQLLRRALPTRVPSPGTIAVLSVTAVAPPIVAVGFVTGHAVPQVGGAVLMTVGVWCTATLQLGQARDRQRRTLTRALLLTSGLAVWVPMVLAVSWAVAQHWNLPALSIPVMARTHGVANAFGFAFLGLLARRLEAEDR